MAELLESAVAVANPGQSGGGVTDPAQYRLPLHCTSIQLGSIDKVSHRRGELEWTPALEAAYHDGYAPLAWLGRGTSAEVWRCVDRAFGREVAVKIPCPKAGRDATLAVDALKEEAELLGRLHHPGVVQAVRLSGDGESAYLALDFVDGEGLLEHCDLLQLDAEARLQLFVKVLAAVAYLHNKAVVHGDLKPDHVLIREDGQPILIDFGLSCYDSALSLHQSESRRVGGSGIYRAPEIVNASATSPETQHDVFSLGVLLRELLINQELGDRASDINRVVTRATQPELEDRWVDGRAMHDALCSALDKKLSLNRFDSPQKHSDPRATRAKPVYRTMVLAATLFLALSAFAWAVADRPNSNTPSDQAGDVDQPQRALVQANLFELTLGEVYDGNTAQARKGYIKMLNLQPNQEKTWEIRHLDAMFQGKGESLPLGASPYDSTHALCIDFDPTTNTIAYAKLEKGTYQLWVQSFEFQPLLIGESVEVIRAVAISPGGEKVASVDVSGSVKLWTIDNAAGNTGTPLNLPKQTDGRVIWFGPNGDTLCFFSPQARTIECWPANPPIPAQPLFTIEDCDHALPLPSGNGAFLAATRGDNTATGLTNLRLIDPSGELIRTQELIDAELPISADTRTDPGSLLCLGMPDGYVRIHNPLQGGWQCDCDLGVNAPVTTVLYSETEQRVFASLGRVHVIDEEGTLLTRLGHRKNRLQLITELSFEDKSDALTVLSTEGVWRCNTE